VNFLRFIQEMHRYATKEPTQGQKETLSVHIRFPKLSTLKSVEYYPNVQKYKTKLRYETMPFANSESFPHTLSQMVASEKMSLLRQLILLSFLQEIRRYTTRDLKQGHIEIATPIATAWSLTASVTVPRVGF